MRKPCVARLCYQLERQAVKTVRIIILSTSQNTSVADDNLIYARANKKEGHPNSPALLKIYTDTNML